MAVTGTAIGLATAISGGLAAGALVEVFVVVATVGYYRLGGHDTDAGAIFGTRTDERQAEIRLRASAFAGEATTVFALAAFVVQTARGASAWPFALVCAVSGISFALGTALQRRA
jgi:hypothetical protein